MEYRKMISFGKGSYVVSLPKDWVVKNKLQKGSVLALEVYPYSMLISTQLAENEAERKTIIINADGKSMEEIQQEIVTAYLTNFDVIELVSKRITDEGEKIKEIITNLAGLEILEYTATKIIAKYLIDLKEISLDSLIRRMDNITRSLMIDTIGCIEGNHNYHSIKQRDLDVNRLNFLVIRSVRAAMGSSKHLYAIGKTVWQLYVFMYLAERIEKISDMQKRISRSLEQLKLSPTFAEELRKVYTQITESYLEVMKAYYQGDRKAASKIEMTNKGRIFACDRLIGRDIKQEYSAIKSENTKEMDMHIHEHMIMTEIINNMKSIAATVKMIARNVMNNEAETSAVK